MDLHFIYLVNNSENISSVLTKRSDQRCSGEFLCVSRQGGPWNDSYEDHFASNDSGVTAWEEENGVVDDVADPPADLS